MSMSYYPLFPVFGCVGFIAGLIPFCWHLQAWNAATCAFMMWSSLGSLVFFVNSIIWHGNVNNVAPVWCDICTKFIIGAGVGLPASSLCINRRLYKIASVRVVSITRTERRRAVLTDVAISIGIPMLVMVLHCIVQGHRFNILEDIGCIPTIFNTPPAYPLVYMWPVLLGCISFVYASQTLHAFWKRRLQFKELITSTSALTVNRYFRLMLLSCLEMTLTVPLTSLSIYLNSHGINLSPWISWSDAHYDFSFVEQIPALVWGTNPQYAAAAEMSRWIYPCSALLFFALFGFAEEAMRNYRLAFKRFKTILRLDVHDLSLGARLRERQLIGDHKAQACDSYTTLPPPVYSPRKLKRSDSLFSSVISFNDMDFEKGLSSSTSTSSPIFSTSETMIGCSEPESPTSTENRNPSPPPSPSPPPIAYHPSPSPPFRRPFSSSTILPLAPTSPTLAGPSLEPPNTLPIVIHRESCQTF